MTKVFSYKYGEHVGKLYIDYGSNWELIGDTDAEAM
tara:strand:- start:450 stop:557 length:108 start_codon:yes stop_codon:yes gene_type:complete